METINTITSARIEELLLSEMKLACLENGGVDNWDWFGDAMTEFEKLRAQHDNRAKYTALIDDLEVALLEGAYEHGDRGAGYACTETARHNAIEVLETYNVIIGDD